mgnify:CR=1 FL=1|jgi:hypothetical protein
MRPNFFGTIFLCFLLLINLSGVPAFAQTAAPMALNVIIVEGEGAINNIKQRVNREQIVQVEDENHRPIAGAAVVFFLPNQGPGGTYPNGTNSLTVTTDSNGRATSRGIRFNNVPGTMQIRVLASYQGLTANAVITQSNVLGAAAATAGGLSLTAKILIAVAVAGGAAAAGIAASGKSSSPSTPPITTTTVTAGTPTVGAP